LNAEITLELKGGEHLRAAVPHDAIADLGIKEGEQFCGVFKASNVVLATEEE
jgi:molybdopterin-binding protein